MGILTKIALDNPHIASNLMKGKTSAPISGFLHHFPLIKKRVRSIEHILTFDRNKLTLHIKNIELDIPYRNIDIIKEEQSMKITVNVDEIELDGFIDKLIDELFKEKNDTEGKEAGKNNAMMKNMLKTVNEASKGEAKYELLSYILGWANKNDMFNKLLPSLAELDEKAGKMINDMKLKLGDIDIEY